MRIDTIRNRYTSPISRKYIRQYIAILTARIIAPA
jgi:hypothetical protein